VTREEATAGPGAGLNTVQKACAVLRALAGHRSPAALRDVAKAAGVNKVTAFRILGTLAGEGFVRRPANSRLYELGPEVLALSAALRRSPNLLDQARLALFQIAAASGDAAVLSVRSGIEAISVDRQTGDYPIQSNYLHPGTRRPLGIGAGATAILAALPDAEMLGLLDLLAPRLAAYPRLSLDDVRDQVAHVRRHGYAVVLDRIVEKMGGIAAPIRSPQGEALGAISIVALSERIEARLPALAELLLAKTAEVERLLAAA
jgi:DNA-binding IclR family transcriptional regulator